MTNYGQNSAPDDDRVFERLLEFLRQSRGFDFTGYKRSSLKRRVHKQMQAREIDSFGDYLDYLEVHPEEFAPLFNTILINVTGFFRDFPTWEYLRNRVIPQILESKLADEPIRIWSAGCASGEEAYSLAILMAEAIGLDQFRSRVKIYATDVDEEALTQARHAIYSEKMLQAIPERWQGTYFERSSGNFVFRSDLRRAIIFGRHDLVQDAPISDVSRYHDLRSELQRSNQELETANEELQSSNEELETTNEELQSTNEELETMNEEMQATNEELHTINDELHLRTLELNDTNAFLNSILSSLQDGVIVVDRQFSILSWNEAIEELWGLRSDGSLNCARRCGWILRSVPSSNWRSRLGSQ
jgi:chemotaxis methyl-accepting protein methylase